MGVSTADKILADINKEFGEGSATYARDMAPIEVCSSGSLSLDFAIGIGGVPKNRVMELVGEEGSGKTSVALLIARQFIDDQPGRLVIVLDIEHKLTPDWVEALIGSARMEKLLVLSPDTIEQATDMYRKTVGTGKVSLVILDSIGGAPTSQVMDEDRSAEKKEMAGNAAGVTKFARFASTFSAKYSCLTIGINQVRDDMGGYHRLVTPGGRGWKHACVLRIQLKRGQEKYFEKINGENVQVGYDVIARCFKNHLATQGRIAQWRFFNQPCKLAPLGVDTTEECIRLAKMVGVVTQAGAYYRHDGFPGGQVMGQAKMLDLIMSDDALRAQLVSEVLAELKADPAKLSEVAPVTDIDEVLDDEPKGFIKGQDD